MKRIIKLRDEEQAGKVDEAARVAKVEKINRKLIKNMEDEDRWLRKLLFAANKLRTLQAVERRLAKQKDTLRK